MNTSTIVGDATVPNTTIATRWTEDALSLENQVAIFLWKAWPPCLLVLGTFGNIATIFVMRRIKDNHSSQHIILMALAVSDFSLLYVSVLRQWLYYQFHVDVYDLHTVVCKLCWWLIYASGMISSWLLTSLTMQRTLAVTWPHRMRMVCSAQRTWTAIATIVCFACVLHSHFVFGMEINWGKCTFRSEQYKDFVKRIWAWVDLTFFTLLPSTCLIVCNIVLSWTLLKASSTVSGKADTATGTKTPRISTIRRNTASRTTIMSLALSCTFLILTLPVCVYLIWDYYAYSDSPLFTRLWTRKILVFAVTMLLWYTNSAINFLLYCFTGTRFRREFFIWFCCSAQTSSTSNSYVSRSSFGFLNEKNDTQQKVK